MEAGPLGTMGYRLRSRDDEGSRAGEKDGEGRSEMEGEEKSNLLSLILCETLPWQRGGETALISGSHAEKGHSISAPPAGVVLTGAAQTRLIMLSVSPPDARG